MMPRSFVPLVAAALLATMGAPSSGSAQGHAQAAQSVDSTTIKERANFLLFVANQRRTIVDAADAMPADKYGFAPTNGEFANVRTFSKQVRHLAATNYILAAAALGERPFDALERAARAIGDERIPVASSPISPMQGGTATRTALIAEAMTHAYDHYGQMVVYLRMNGVIPPASRR
jgi:predicted HD phosphohydrolase